jgi:hypothetical protein
MLPGNRFITPESQGGVLNNQLEIQNTSATQATVRVNDNYEIEGVTYREVSRTGFLFSSSLFNQLDLVWSHAGSGNSLFGAKFQFNGASRSEKGTGHKFAIGALFGGNKYETDDKSVEFELGGQEYLVLYGYRFSEMVLLYSNFSYATYHFDGVVHSSVPEVNGLKPKIDNTLRGLYIGTEITYLAVSFKLECGYQQIISTDTEDLSHFITGFGLGLSW